MGRPAGCRRSPIAIDPTGSSPYSGWRRILRTSASVIGDWPMSNTLLGPDRNVSRRAGRRPGARSEHDPRNAEGERLGEVEAVPAEQLRSRPRGAGPEHEGVEEGGQIVERRGVDALDVALVEAVEAEEHEPDGQRGEEPEQVQVPGIVWNDEQRERGGAHHG